MKCVHDETKNVGYLKNIEVAVIKNNWFKFKLEKTWCNCRVLTLGPISITMLDAKCDAFSRTSNINRRTV